VHPLLRPIWSLSGLTAELAARLIAPGAPGSAKWRRSLTARRDLAARYHAFAAQRDRTQPLLWMHAPSVGEGLQALPVVQRCQASTRPPQIAVTWFSPSAEAFGARFQADFGDYLPFDTARGARTALDALRPTALVYSKLDVWPTLTAAAEQRGVALGMIAATLRPGSGRTGPFARALLRDAYAALDLVGAIASEDAERLVTLGVRRDAIRVTGDSRYDQVWERARRPPTDAQWLTALSDGRPTLVAGSTWPADEQVLLPAWAAHHRAYPGTRLVIAPHEPSAAHLSPIRQWASSEGLTLATLDQAGAERADVVLVDRVGVLGDLYGIATAAFVGGGFHAEGLHSVLEPAAFGAPVLFGPQHRASRDARRLLEAEGALAVADTTAATAALNAWLGDPAAARDSGTAARRVVESELGAADRAFTLVQTLLGRA
jgi:3-deoxy-D-manno-octulosonic-acid transferase